ncbi:MAG: hypothetical protein JWL75_668 [Parcubacteria group bacterium]|nr:hypothetical protein [Parcubacteria group bacterium]
MKQRPKHYRQRIYDYIEELLERPLTFDEHDILRDMIGEYVFSVGNIRAVLSRAVCSHDWKVDKKIEGGEKLRLFVKCVKCDKRTSKKMPVHSIRVGS